MGNDCFYGVKTELERLAELLRAQNWMLGTAESCTGGMVAALCTTMAGSSAWFQGGVVSYANEAKVRLLHVDAGLIETYGAVSQPVAEAMARGALEVLNIDVSLAITGIAGPTGGTKEKPVGTVWIGVGVRHPNLAVSSRVYHFTGGRAEVRAGAVQMAIAMVLGRLVAL